MSSDAEVDEEEIRQKTRRKQQYDGLKQMLLAAARDCEERGHAKGVSDRFLDASEICDRAAGEPGD